MPLFLLCILLVSSCASLSRTTVLENKVRVLEERLSDLEADWALFTTTPNGHWIFPNNNGTTDRKSKSRAKK
jgi:hypothetical protein